MKKFTMVLIWIMVLMTAVSPAMAQGCDCGCVYCNPFCSTEWKSTIMVVAGDEWNYDVQVNARIKPDISSTSIATIPGGTELNVSYLAYAKDGRVWARVWYKSEWMYVSMKYLQPIEDKGTYFYLIEAEDVWRKASYRSTVYATLDAEQLILVKEVENNQDGWWAKILTNGRYGYIRLESLISIW